MKTVIFTYIVVIFSTLFFFSCKKESKFGTEYSISAQIKSIENDGVSIDLSISNFSLDRILDIGVVWSSTENPSYEYAEHYSLGTKAENRAYSVKICSALSIGEKYYVRGYIKSAEGFTYSDQISFVSKGNTIPVISSFSPQKASIRDTVTIIGSHFSSLKGINTVFFGSAIDPNKENVAEIVYVSSDTLKVIIPPSITADRSKISVSIGLNSSGSASDFVLAAPTISSFAPISANIGDTIDIKGSGFSPITSENRIFFAGIDAQIIRSTRTSIKAVVPPKLNVASSQIFINVVKSMNPAPTAFNLLTPTINDFQPRSATYGALIKIDGTNFSSKYKNAQVLFGTQYAQIVSISNNEIIVKAPDDLKDANCTLSVEMNNQKTIANSNFVLSLLQTNDFYPKKTTTGNQIKIIGSNFSPILSNNIVKIGNVQANVIAALPNELTAILPTQDIAAYDSRELTITVEVAGAKQILSDKLVLNDKWFRHHDSSIQFSYLYLTQLDNKIYLGLSKNNELWEYDIITNQGKRLADFPGLTRADGQAFIIGQQMYFGMGNTADGFATDIWVYDIGTDTWSKKTDFPGKGRYNACFFSIGNDGYVGGGSDNYEDWIISTYYMFSDFWKYSPSTNSWSQITNYNNLANYGRKGVKGSTIVLGDKAFVGLGWDPEKTSFNFSAYNSRTNLWEQYADYPFYPDYSATFYSGGDIYIRTYYNTVYAYSISTNTWTITDAPQFPRLENCVGFSINDIGYLVFNQQIWEFDPSR